MVNRSSTCWSITDKVCSSIICIIYSYHLWRLVLDFFFNFFLLFNRMNSTVFRISPYPFLYNMNVSKITEFLRTNPLIAHQDLFYCPIWCVCIRSDDKTQIAFREGTEWRLSAGQSILSAKGCVTTHVGTVRVYVFVAEESKTTPSASPAATTSQSTEMR